MQLPERKRRSIAYAVAALVAVSGLAYAGKLGSGVAPNGAAAVAQAGKQAADEATKESNPPAASAEAAEATQQAARPKIEIYKVAEGDNVHTIAQRFGLKEETVLWANGLSEDDLLQIDQELKIPAVDGLVYSVADGDNFWTIADATGSTVEEIAKANPEIDPGSLQPDAVLIIPGGKPAPRRLTVASRGEERTAPAPAPAKTGSLKVWPVQGVITDHFGWRIHPVRGTNDFHDGMDMSVPIGTPVVAAAGGEVTYAGYMGGYGLVVKVDHGGVVTMYAHLSRAAVSVGESVGAGDVVAYSGNTGVSTGPHLHFTVFSGGTPVDPLSWLP